MSWAIASFAIVLGVLIAGWVAYERSHPPARMVAVIGTLAALAALGRDAFAALPEVKPITAMTLVVGYALGPLPGFAVGAIGMLASNLMLGEGSYTPWQMMAWGTVGLVGAALGTLTGRRAPRVAIALACALSALGAKEIMNIYTWTLGASHTPAALLATAASALPFDVTDTVASFLFGLAFAPELARLLARTRARMTVRWEPVAPLAALALALAPAASLCAQPARARAASLARPLAYLQGAQNPDGGFGGARGQRSSELFSAWAALGLAAAGRDPARAERGGHSVLAAIRAQVSTLQGAGDLERTILALRACGAPPRLPGLGDLTMRLLRYRSPDGSFEHLVNITSFAILALRAAGRSREDPIVRPAVAWLSGQQGASGGFGYAGGGSAADVDDTAGALQAIAAAERSPGPQVQRAVAYLLRAENRDGGFPQQPGGESNAQSTAWAVQALVAAHRDPAGAPPQAARSPLSYLISLLAPDGSVRYSRTSSQTPVWVTAQALTALAREPLPIDSPRSAAGWGQPASSSGAHRGASLTEALSSTGASRGAPAEGVDAQARRRAMGTLSGQTLSRQTATARALSRAALDALARTAGVLIAIALRPMER